MAYSNEELTLRVKHLEQIVLDIMAINSSLRTGALCFNTSLHPDEDGEHPDNLLPPHYTFQPQIDWGKDIVNLGIIKVEQRLIPYPRYTSA